MFDYILPIYFVILHNRTGVSHLKVMWLSMLSDVDRTARALTDMCTTMAVLQAKSINRPAVEWFWNFRTCIFVVVKTARCIWHSGCVQHSDFALSWLVNSTAFNVTCSLEAVTGVWVKLDNEELRDLYSSSVNRYWSWQRVLTVVRCWRSCLVLAPV